MSRLLFFHLETNSVHSLDSIQQVSEGGNPRLVQLAFILCDHNENIINSGHYIVKPKGFVIPRKAALRHGVSHSRALKIGIPIYQILSDFFSAVIQADYFICHGFDNNNIVIEAESRRLGFQAHYNQMLLFKEKICTRCSTKELLQIPNGKNFKPPSLSELNNALFDRDYINTQNILNDVFTCAKCFFELTQKGHYKIYSDYLSSVG